MWNFLVWIWIPLGCVMYISAAFNPCTTLCISQQIYCILSGTIEKKRNKEMANSRLIVNCQFYRIHLCVLCVFSHHSFYSITCEDNRGYKTTLKGCDTCRTSWPQAPICHRLAVHINIVGHKASYPAFLCSTRRCFANRSDDKDCYRRTLVMIGFVKAQYNDKK